ncbi:IS21 family transposase [bacterium]|nr:IS21 family transposase [bacterium]
MKTTEEWLDIHMLRKQGHSIRKIARLTGNSRNTVRRILRQKAPCNYDASGRESQLDAFKDYAKKRYEECALSAVRILEEIRPMGYTGSIYPLRRYLQTLQQPAKALKKLTVRFETAPGEQAQIDWGYCGRFPDPQGKLISIYVFTMVLCFSRMLFIKFTNSMRLPALLGCHQEAFQFFGGWCASFLYDNMKQVRINQQEWNPQFLDFANYYGIVPQTCRIKRPRTKGKVERPVHYIKDNFLNGRSFADVEDLNILGLQWLNNTANVRIHGTTECRPVDLFSQEKLTPYASIAPYRYHPWLSRKVDSESFVRLDRSRYWVPPENVGKKVFVQKGEQKIVIRCGDLIIAEHDTAEKPGSTVATQDQIAQLWKLSLQQSTKPEPRWEVRFTNTVDVPSLDVYEEVSR